MVGGESTEAAEVDERDAERPFHMVMTAVIIRGFPDRTAPAARAAPSR